MWLDDDRRRLLTIPRGSGRGRITSLARTIDVHERVNVTARVLAGLAAVPGVQVYLSQPNRLVERALALLAALPEAT